MFLVMLPSFHSLWLFCVTVIVDCWFKSWQLPINTDFRIDWWFQGFAVTESDQCWADSTQRFSKLAEPKEGMYSIYI